MRRFSALVLAGAFLICLCGCGGGNGVGPLSIAFTNSVGAVPGGTMFVFSVTTQNDTQNRGVNFTLALNTPSNNETTTPCTTACGSISAPTNTIVANGPKTFTTTTTVTYSAPLLPPTPNNLILTATANANSSLTTTDTFTVGAPQIVVRITNKITNIEPGAAPVTLNASVQFDTTNAGVTWMLTAQGAACSPACGTITNPQPFSVVYAPPTSVPAAPNNTPTITATSVTNTSISDFDDLRIQSATLPVSVSITNPFTQITAGGEGVTINAQVTNDVADQGVTWSLEPASDAGALSAEQPLSVIYTPPNNAPQPPNNTPTITATSVADNTKSASFSFTIESSSEAFAGPYAFVIRGHDDSGNTMAAVGSFTSDGAGKITTGEIDLNTGNASAPETTAPVTGSYQRTVTNAAERLFHIQLSGTLIPGGTSPLDFDGRFRSRPGHPDSTTNFDLAEISGHSGAWTLSGDMERQDLSSAQITNFTGRKVRVALTRNSGSGGYENGDFALSDSGSVLEGALEEHGTLTFSRSSGDESVAGFFTPQNDIVGGNLASFDRSGRATLTLFMQFSEGARHFALYAVSPTRLIVIEADSSQSAETGIVQVTSTPD